VLGPLGTSPDYYKEVDTNRICAVMRTVHERLRSGNFAQGQRVWIFKLAEVIYYLPLLERICGSRFRFILNIRNPLCQSNWHYFTDLEKVLCFLPKTEKLKILLDKIPNKIISGDKDLLHLLTFNDILMPAYHWLQQEMRGRFTAVRHEDLLTEEGLYTFSNNVASILGITGIMDRNFSDIAEYNGNHSRNCERRQIPVMIKNYVENFMNTFNYTSD